MTQTTNTNVAAINEIMNHDRFVGEVLDCASDIKSMTIKSVESVKNTVYSGLKGSSEYRMMYSAQREEDDWNAFAQRYGLDLMPVVHKPDTYVSADIDKPKATVKANFKNRTLHGSYVSATASHPKMEKAFIYRLKLEDELDIKPIDNPYALKDTEQLIKVVGFEYRKPYIIIQAIKAEDEHDRLKDTRTSDETPIIYFTIDVSQKVNHKGQPIENPELSRLRKWMWNKVEHTEKISFSSAIEQLIDRICLISLNSESEDFIGYPTYDLDERFNPSYNRFDSEYLNSFRASRIG